MFLKCCFKLLNVFSSCCCKSSCQCEVQLCTSNFFVIATGHVDSVKVYITNKNEHESVIVRAIIPLYPCCNIAISDQYNLTQEERIIRLTIRKLKHLIIVILYLFYYYNDNNNKNNNNNTNNYNINHSDGQVVSWPDCSVNDGSSSLT